MNNAGIIVCHTIEAMAAYVAGSLKKETATEVTETFLRARFTGMERYRRWLQQVAQAENQFRSRLKDIKST